MVSASLVLVVFIGDPERKLDDGVPFPLMAIWDGSKCGRYVRSLCVPSNVRMLLQDVADVHAVAFECLEGSGCSKGGST